MNFNILELIGICGMFGVIVYQQIKIKEQNKRLRLTVPEFISEEESE